jgi:hypothetical protein
MMTESNGRIIATMFSLKVAEVMDLAKSDD